MFCLLYHISFNQSDIVIAKFALLSLCCSSHRIFVDTHQQGMEMEPPAEGSLASTVNCHQLDLEESIAAQIHISGKLKKQFQIYIGRT